MTGSSPYGTPWHIVEPPGSDWCDIVSITGLTIAERLSRYYAERIVGLANAARNSQSPTLAEVLACAQMTCVPATEAEQFWHHFESTGWIDKNGHQIVNWQSKLRTWRGNSQAGAYLAKANGKAQSVWELKAVMEAKKQNADELKRRHCSELPLGQHWDTPAAKLAYMSLRKEIREINNQLSKLG